LWHTLIAAAVLTGVQWAVVTAVSDRWTVLAVLGVPALFAGRTVARLMADTTTAFHRSGGGRR
jgi:hypothetical protein